VDEKNDQQSKANPQQELARFKRTEGFETLYANNVAFEANVWDMKLLFGELTSDEQGNVIEQHTGMVLPWPLVKVLAFHLAINIVAFEDQHGPIRLATPILPLVTNLTAKSKADPRIMAIFTALMVGGNPELFSVEGPGTLKLAEEPTEKPESNAT
jgi:hypothetical protein